MTSPIAVDSATVYAVLNVNPSTLRTWVQRGHVRKLGRDAYDLGTIKAYMARRYRLDDTQR